MKNLHALSLINMVKSLLIEIVSFLVAFNTSY